MRVLQIVRHHWNYSIGGLELYVKDLVTGLLQRGVNNTLLTFQPKAQVEIDNDNRFPIIKFPRLSEENREKFARDLKAKLMEDSFDCAHFHLFRDEEYITAKILNELKIPYIFTYHLPAACCLRGNLMRWGMVVCDSKTEYFKCTACRIQNRLKTNRALSYTAALINALFSETLFSLWKKQWSKIDYWESTKQYIDMLRYFLTNTKLGISCSEWGIRTLEMNGVDKKRVVYMPQGLPLEFEENSDELTGSENNSLIIGYVGRISPEKGVHILVDAFKKVKDENARLEIYGFKHNERSVYEKELYRSISTDARIKACSRLSHSELAKVYRRIGFLAIPSVCPETGPLVVWEALAFGIPIIASERIGHKSLLENGNRGILVAPHTEERWVEILEIVLRNEKKFIKEKTKFRTMNTVADEMVRVYISLKGDSNERIANNSNFTSSGSFKTEK